MEHHLVRSIGIHNCLLVLINSIEHIGGYTTHSSCEIHSYIISSCLHCITLYPLIYQFTRYICFLKHLRSQYHILLVIYVCVMCRYMYVYIYMFHSIPYIGFLVTHIVVSQVLTTICWWNLCSKCLCVPVLVLVYRVYLGSVLLR